jgi:hypothetical protein
MLIHEESACHQAVGPINREGVAIPWGGGGGGDRSWCHFDEKIRLNCF